MKRTDWREIGLEFRRHGWTQLQVAEHLKVARGTVRKWFAGSEPGYRYGQALLQLHRNVVQFKVRCARWPH